MVLFGLSHACNLRCHFCSRDAEITDRWDADEAFELLRDLADAGTLEVAFGGGEPLAYAGFADLVGRLAAETPLAVHVTTNGTLVTPAIAEALSGSLGEARVSIYEDEPWGEAVAMLVAAGIRTAANIVVRPETLDALPALLAQLAELGCDNVALLRYLGDQPLHLSADGFDALESVIARSPVSIRLSHCFADQLPNTPRLFHGTANDACGAGDDFVVVDPDRTFRPCSFHQTRRSFDGAADLLAQYRDFDFDSGAAAHVKGCARPFEGSGLSDGVRLYAGFSSNNSGDTVMVARFDDPAVPTTIADALIDAGGSSHENPVLRGFFAEHGVKPDREGDNVQVRAVGSTLLATGYDAYDALPGLREVVWKNGGLVVHSAVHIHHSAELVFAIGGAGGDKAIGDALFQTAFAKSVQRHGDTLFATAADKKSDWTEVLASAQSVASDAGHPLVAELLGHEDEDRLVDTLKSSVGGGPGDPDARGYLALWFADVDRARSFHASMKHPRKSSHAGNCVLVDLARPRTRLGLRVQEAGGTAVWLPRAPVRVHGMFYRDYRKPPVEQDDVTRALGQTSGTPLPFQLSKSHRSVRAELDTEDPHEALTQLARAAKTFEVRLWAGVRPARPLAHTVARLTRALTVLR